MKYLISTSLLCAFITMAYIVQAQTKCKKIKIGEEIPNFSLDGIVNDQKESIHIKDVEADLIIIDFWNISCSSCILSFPKLDSLQKQFSPAVKLIMVTKNSQAEVEKLFSKTKFLKPDIPMIVSDSTLFNYFPHTSVPHHVWIDGKSKVVRYITEGYNTTPANISSFLNGKLFKLHYKNEIIDFDEHKPFLANDGGGLAKNIQLYSSIVNRIDEYGGNTFFLNYDSVNGIIGLKVINASLLQLYKIAFGESITRKGIFEDEKRVYLKVRDQTKLIYPAEPENLDSWMQENSYGYESFVPVSKKKLLYSILRSDLRRNFPYKAFIQKKRTLCYVLQKRKGINIRTNYPNQPLYSDGYKMINAPISFIFERIHSFMNYFDKPIVNSIDNSIYFDFDITGLQTGKITKDAILKQLQINGLELVKKEAVIEVLVISD